MDLERLRQAYRPPQVGVLLIAESPPKGGRFFYRGDSNLFHYTCEAFQSAFGLRFRGPEEFLSAFKRNGCYLEDLSVAPLDHLKGSPRERARREAAGGLVNKVRSASPRAVVCVMKGISEIVRTAVVEAGFGTVLFDVVAFPANGHQTEYVRELAAILRRHRAEGRLGNAESAT